MANVSKAEVLKNKEGETFSPVTSAKAVKVNGTSHDTLNSSVRDLQSRWEIAKVTADEYLTRVEAMSDSTVPDGLSEKHIPDNTEYVFATQIEKEHEKATVDSTTGAHGIHKSEDGTKLVFTDVNRQNWEVNLKEAVVEHTVSPIQVHAKNGILPPVSGHEQKVSSDVLKLYPNIQTAITDNKTWRELGYLESKNSGSSSSGGSSGSSQTLDTIIHYTMLGYGDCVGFFPKGSGSHSNSIDSIIKTYNRYHIKTPKNTESELDKASIDTCHNVIPHVRYFKEFDYTAEKSIPYVALYWTDPEDTDTFKWKETRVVRKLGKPPVDVTDGILVAYTAKDDPRGFGKNRFSSESAAVLDFEYQFNSDYNELWKSMGKDSADNSMIMYYRWFVIDETGYVYPNANSTAGKKYKETWEHTMFTTNEIADSYFGEDDIGANDITDNSIFFRNCTRMVYGGVAISSQPAYPQRCTNGTPNSENVVQGYTNGHYGDGVFGAGYFATHLYQQGAITFTTTNRYTSKFQGKTDTYYSPSLGYHEFSDFEDEGYTSATLNKIFDSLMIPVAVDQEGNILAVIPRSEQKFCNNPGEVPYSTLPIEPCYKAWNTWGSKSDSEYVIGDNYEFVNVNHNPGVSASSTVKTRPDVINSGGITSKVYKAVDTARSTLSTIKTTSDAFRISNPEIKNTVTFIRTEDSSGKSLASASVQEKLNSLFTITNDGTSNLYYARTSNSLIDVFSKRATATSTNLCVEYPSDDSPLILSNAYVDARSSSNASDTSKVVTIAPGESLQFEVMLYMPLMYYKITPLDLTSDFGETGNIVGSYNKSVNTSSYTQVLIELSSEPLHGFKVHPAFIHYTNAGTKDKPVLKKTIVPYILMSPWSGTIMESDLSDPATPGVAKRFTSKGIFTDAATNYINPVKSTDATSTDTVGPLREGSTTGQKIYYPVATLISPNQTTMSSSSSIIFTGMKLNTPNDEDDDKYGTEINSFLGYKPPVDVLSIVTLNHNTKLTKFISITGGLPFCTPTCISGTINTTPTVPIVGTGSEKHVSREVRAITVDKTFKEAIKNKGKDWHMPTLSAMELIRLYYLCEYGTLDKYAMMFNENRGSLLVGEGAIKVAELATTGTQTWKECDISDEALDTTTSSTHLPPKSWLARREKFFDFWHKVSYNPSTLLYKGYKGTTFSPVNDPGVGGLPISLYSGYYVYAPFTTISTGVHALYNYFQSGWNIVRVAPDGWTGAANTTKCSATAFQYLALSYHGFDLNNLGMVDNQTWDSTIGLDVSPDTRSNCYTRTLIYSVLDNLYKEQYSDLLEHSSLKLKNNVRQAKINTIPNDSGQVTQIVEGDYEVTSVTDYTLGKADHELSNACSRKVTNTEYVAVSPANTGYYRPIQYSPYMDWVFTPGQTNFGASYSVSTNYTGLFVNVQSVYPQRDLQENMYDEADSKPANKERYLYYSPRSLMIDPNVLRDTNWVIRHTETLTSGAFSFAPNPNESYTTHIEFIPSPRVENTNT